MRGERWHTDVLDTLPTAVVVVAPAGTVRYGNQALERLIGISMEDGLDTNMLEYVHPDDAHWLAEAFMHLGATGGAEREVAERPWAPINCRVVDTSGRAIPVEVMGTGRLHEVGLDGVIYELRVARERDIFHRVLAGVASSGDAHGQLELIVELISASPLGIDSVVARWDVGGRCEVVTAATSDLIDAFERAADSDGLRCFATPSSRPNLTLVADVTDSIGADLRRRGYADAWHVDVAPIVGDWTYRIVGLTEIHQIPAQGVIDRLVHAAELASVTLLRAQADEQLEHAALHDELTGLLNRSGLRRLIDERRHRIEDLTVLYVDLDGFKEVNDRHGHRQGDTLLQMVATRLEGVVSDGSVVIRLGGDEFAVLVADADDAEARQVADAITASLARPFTTGARHLTISASVGVAAVRLGHDVDLALSAADRAMYEAKRAGGNRVFVSSAAAGRPR